VRQEDGEFEDSPGKGRRETLSQKQNKNKRLGVQFKWKSACAVCTKPWELSQLHKINQARAGEVDKW
jgi:hypothetical protein